MSDEEMAQAARGFLAALNTFIAACDAYGAPQLDLCDPVRELWNDARWVVRFIQAELHGAEQRMKQARNATVRRNRTPRTKTAKASTDDGSAA